MSSDYFLKLGKVNLGNTDRLIAWIESIEKNIHKLLQYPVRTKIKTDLTLSEHKTDEQNYLLAVRYGINPNMMHFMFGGPGLKCMFDDWSDVFKQITDKVGPCDFDYPAIVYTPSHVFRHFDNRNAALNIGLYNSDKGCNLYWQGRDLVAWHNIDYEEAVLMRVQDAMHSLTQDDSYGGYMRPRAVLSFDVSTPYLELINKL